jgi:glycine/D-amino acid oxidase-like deaminating enzyme
MSISASDDMARTRDRKYWGNRPWTIDFVPQKHELPKAVDFAVVGGGFTGLSAAARLKHLAPEASVALFEMHELGSGSSGHTGGMALSGTAVGDLPGLGDVLSGYQKTILELDIDGDLTLPGAYELGRKNEQRLHSPIHWKDSGDLAAVNLVEGGSVNPGEVLNGLGRAAERAGTMLFENCPVTEARFSNQVELRTVQGALSANKVLFATNAFSFELTGLHDRAESMFTLAVATQELSDEGIEAIGLGERKPFYTIDMPYLWGRLLGNAIIFGSGLLHQNDWRDLETLDINAAKPAKMFSELERRIRGLHPFLRKVSFTHRWGGPICVAEEWKPVFEQHHKSHNAIVLGAFSGHGVAQSVYLGSWAAEVLLARRALPKWRGDFIET